MENSRLKIHPTMAFIFLTAILLGAFFVRLYRIDNPIADWHSWRQADTSAVSRYFVQHGFDILHPHFEDLSNVPSGLENPQGFRFVEFPIYNVAQAGLFELFPIFTLEEWGRLVSIFASLCTTIFLYLIIKKYISTLSGLFVAFFYAFLPFNIYYSRTILPDTSMVTAIVGATYFFAQSIELNNSSTKRYVYLALSLIFTASAFLLKPYALFFTLPMILLAIMRFKINILRQWMLYIFLVLSVLPLIWWRVWMQHYPAGIPASDWLFNGGDIRFRPAYFYWIYADRFARLILGYWGVFLFLLGALITSGKDFTDRHKEALGLISSFLLSSLIYVTVIARGNVQHDYYQILIIPTICIYAGVGCVYLVELSHYTTHPFVGRVILTLTIIFTLFFGWYFVRDYFNINNPDIVVAGNAVDKLIPKDAKVIASYNGDTSFLYQTNRQGWPVFEHDLSQMIVMGADYLVFADPKPSELGLKSQYKIVSQTPQYILYDLHQKP